MTDFDPTTNRVPFGLLSEDEQIALSRWPHGWEIWRRDEWHKIMPRWNSFHVYRGKPAPVVTSQWINVYPNSPCSGLHASRKSADNSSLGSARIAVLRIDTCNGVSTAHLEEVGKTNDPKE